jgi:nucleotide-binding universal stress UspA family protein
VETQRNAVMHRHILIPTDGSDLSKQAIEYGIALAKAVNAQVTGLTVSTPFHAFTVDSGTLTDTPESYKKRTTEVVAKHLRQVNEVAVEAGVNCNVVHAEHEHPYQAIIDVANEKGCDLIVMASHGRRGISAILLGSETVKVLTHSNVPVLVCREPRSRLFPPSFAAS